jgi:hypothetical protein
MADPLIMHEIDHMRGKTCGTCLHYVPIDHTGKARHNPHSCVKGYGPADETDGCDDWDARTVDQAELAS